MTKSGNHRKNWKPGDIFLFEETNIVVCIGIAAAYGKCSWIEVRISKETNDIASSLPHLDEIPSHAKPYAEKIAVLGLSTSTALEMAAQAARLAYEQGKIRGIDIAG